MSCVVVLFFFFFSSRRRHTRYIGDWSSDVCSSDLQGQVGAPRFVGDTELLAGGAGVPIGSDGEFGAELGVEFPAAAVGVAVAVRSEERRVGKECRSGGSRDP